MGNQRPGTQLEASMGRGTRELQFTSLSVVTRPTNSSREASASRSSSSGKRTSPMTAISDLALTNISISELSTTPTQESSAWTSMLSFAALASVSPNAVQELAVLESSRECHPKMLSNGSLKSMVATCSTERHQLFDNRLAKRWL